MFVHTSSNDRQALVSLERQPVQLTSQRCQLPQLKCTSAWSHTARQTRVYTPAIEAENNNWLEAASFDELHNLVDIIRGGGAPLAPAPTPTPAPSATPATPSATAVMPIPVSRDIPSYELFRSDLTMTAAVPKWLK